LVSLEDRTTLDSQEGHRAQPLFQVLKGEGLTYEQVARHSLPGLEVGSQTISDVARGARRGHDRSRQRILIALNRFKELSGHDKRYTWDELYSEPPMASG
jgi:hypothetical protein